MLQPENKGILAPPKNSVLSEASQRTVFFADPAKEQGLKTYILEQTNPMLFGTMYLS
jgi:hypothetical protein